MKALIIEDNPDIQESVKLIFDMRWPDADILIVGTGKEGMEKVTAEPPDIVILDLGLPDIDGLKVLKEIVGTTRIPVVILTVRGQDMDKIKALELGAYDYIVKPFTPKELLARIKNVLKYEKIPGQGTETSASKKPELSIDLNNRTVSKNGKKVLFTATEFNLLKYLASKPGETLTREELLETVWGKEYADCFDNLKEYIHRLRVKLEDDPERPKIILSDKQNGYKFAKLNINY